MKYVFIFFLRFVMAVFWFHTVLARHLIKITSRLKSVLVKMEVNKTQRVGRIIVVSKFFCCRNNICLLIEFCFYFIMHILLPVTIKGLAVFPVIGIFF